MHFPPSLEEVTVSVSDERMWVRNHMEEHGTLLFSISPAKITVDIVHPVWLKYNAVSFSFEKVNLLSHS